MGVRIKHPEPTKVTTITKDGECNVTISIELTLNINSDGLSVSASVKPKDTKEIPEEEDTKWAIPDFESQKIEFGKKG